LGGTLSINGATCAIFKINPPLATFQISFNLQQRPCAGGRISGKI